MTPVLLDTSAWIEFLRRTGSKTNEAVRTLVQEDEPLATTDVVVMELLMGAPGSEARNRIWSLMNRCTMLPVRPLFEYEQAALLYVRCRQNGFTPANSNDLLVASVAIGQEVPLLAADTDFGHIAAVSSLRLIET